MKVININSRSNYFNVKISIIKLIGYRHKMSSLTIMNLSSFLKVLYFRENVDNFIKASKQFVITKDMNGIQ